MSLNWESPYAIALELRREHPDVDLQRISLGQVFEWAVALPAFEDDPAVCNDEILWSIYQEWYEVTIHVSRNQT